MSKKKNLIVKIRRERKELEKKSQMSKKKNLIVKIRRE